MTAPSQAVERGLSLIGEIIEHEFLDCYASGNSEGLRNAESAKQALTALTARVRELEAALTDAREYLLNCSTRASDPSGKEWGRIMDASRAVLWGTR